MKEKERRGRSEMEEREVEEVTVRGEREVCGSGEIGRLEIKKRYIEVLRCSEIERRGRREG